MAPPPVQQQHYLVVAFPGQGHISPARALAERLARAGELVTLSTAVSAHRRMFPSLSSPDEEVVVADGAGGVSYAPYSDGYDRGFRIFAGSEEEAWRYGEAFSRVGRETLSAVLDRLAARGRPVTRVVYAMLMWWAAEVARERGIPRALYWIQPARMLAVYHHYFHGYERLIADHAAEPWFTVAMPGLPPMAIRDLPSFFTNATDGRIAAAFDDIRKTFRHLDVDVDGGAGSTAKPMVLVNTVEALEADALASVPGLDLFPVGPAVVSLIADVKEGAAGAGSAVVGDLYEHDEKANYTKWLDTKPAGSVVYVSFGTMSSVSKRQKEQIKRGLAMAGRSYLWVVRKDNRDDGVPLHDDDDDGGGGGGGELAARGMVVEWCDQVRVLSNPAVGCFVTHCGWNSTLESVACGAPVVAVPQWSDQDTNARLVVEWGTGVRAAADGDRVMEGEELARCLEVVMGDSEEGVSIRRSSAAWKAKVQEAIADGGSSHRNLTTFLHRFADAAAAASSSS